MARLHVLLTELRDKVNECAKLSDDTKHCFSAALHDIITESEEYETEVDVRGFDAASVLSVHEQIDRVQRELGRKCKTKIDRDIAEAVSNKLEVVRQIAFIFSDVI